MKFRYMLLLVLGLLLFGLRQSGRGADAPTADEKSEKAKFHYTDHILPFLQKNCFECHSGAKIKGEVAFDTYKDDLSVQNDRKTWDKVVDMLRTNKMPPEKHPQHPAKADVEAVLTAIEGVMAQLECGTGPQNPGRVTIRRLNKTEYNNTIHDLIGVTYKPADDFPADDVGYGFDNIGDVLSMSPLLLEKYLAASEMILGDAIEIYDPPKAGKSPVNFNAPKSAITAGEIAGTISFDAGDYTISATVYAEQAGDQPVRAKFAIAGKAIGEYEITGTAAKPQVLETKVRMEPGTDRVGVTFLNPLPGAADAAPVPAPKANGRLPSGPIEATPNTGQRALYVKSLQVDGPTNPPAHIYSPTHVRLMAHKDNIPSREAAKEIITRFANQAYRRPAKPAEVDAALALFDKESARNQRFENCIKAAMYRVMISPNFLFRVELDPPNAKPGDTYPVDEYALASRLSYFLWNSMPDQELFDLAAKGQLRQNFDAQITRMTKSAKSVSFVQGFAEQWLLLRKLELASPDPKLFPSFDADLKSAMATESKLYFDALVREDRSILDLLDSDFTFVNEKLASLYGIPGVKGTAFVKVKLPAHRGGVLTQASFLTLTSNATRTSPVKRGKFVLEQIFNTPPPPPPDNIVIPALDDQKELTGTLRQIMEQHRKDAMCASCHARMDPIGFGFENFDAIGAWRDKDSGGPINPSGTLPDGKSFDGPDGLKLILKDKKDLFIRCITEKMFTYALGRGLEYYDRCAVDHITDALAKNDYKFSTLISEIVKSDAFQMRTVSQPSKDIKETKDTEN